MQVAHWIVDCFVSGGHAAFECTLMLLDGRSAQSGGFAAFERALALLDFLASLHELPCCLTRSPTHFPNVPHGARWSCNEIDHPVANLRLRGSGSAGGAAAASSSSGCKRKSADGRCRPRGGTKRDVFDHVYAAQRTARLAGHEVLHIFIVPRALGPSQYETVHVDRQRPHQHDDGCRFLAYRMMHWM
jgi:hypothetical protein